ncbi:MULTISPECIES: hypothetical protein [Haloferax]|uniref:Uncharacterized protein n=2 Tax=Haloferax TaxID=2251 RepID=A0A6G1Z6R1_9EURY|nr:MULTISPECIES: hypothetical protein [Haloferax]KAB1185515.1 hypothetical protein Hfx1149_15820 [Haloferax sp. CBA1149]MRW82165.1 hypothetical protein [Haloferax marinisediminis]
MQCDLVEQFTGLVVESLYVTQDFGTATVGCRQCPDTTLVSGDRVTVALSCYEDFSWEIEGVYCASHGIDSVESVMDIRAEQQAVVSAVLEASGYYPPRGRFQPDALTLGEVGLLDFSPTEAGY